MCTCLFVSMSGRMISNPVFVLLLYVNIVLTRQVLNQVHGHGGLRDSGFYFNLFDSVSDMEGKNEIRKYGPSVLGSSCLTPIFCPCSAATFSKRECWGCAAALGRVPREELPGESQHKQNWSELN